MDRLFFVPDKPTFRQRRFESQGSQNIDSFYDFIYSISSLDQIAVPVRLMYKGIEIRILEVSKTEFHDHVDYFVVVQFKYGDKLTRTFTIFCNSIEDFIEKLRIELIRFRLFNKLLPDVLETVSARGQQRSRF